MTSTDDPTPDLWSTPRDKVVTWHDPLPAAHLGRQRSGREHLQAMIDGEVPPAPISRLLGFELRRIGDGECWFAMTPDDSGYNPLGTVHGGIACTLLDSAAGCAFHTTLDAGVGYTSLEIKVSYLRPILAGSGELTAHGWVTKPGRRAAFAEADLRDASGKVLATASSTLLVLAG
jgi:uncharacterized protein (TIGR00369 family)